MDNGLQHGGWEASLRAQMVTNLPAEQETWVQLWVGKIPWRREWLITQGSLPGESQGQRSLVVYSPCGHKESDMTEQLTLSLLLSHGGPALIDSSDSHILFHHFHQLTHGPFPGTETKMKNKEPWGGKQNGA